MFHDGAAGIQLDPWMQTALLAVAVLAGGYLAMRLVVAGIAQALRRTRVDRTLAHFLATLVRGGGWVVLVVAVLAVLGVELTALMGGVAVGGFILGFALKDTLGNLAAGAMLLFYRPFEIGDTVTMAGHEGEVVSLGMSLSVMRTGDGRLVNVPNGKVLGDAIVNHTRAPARRADVTVGVSRDDDIEEATRCILAVLREDPRVLPEPAPTVRITGISDKSVDLQVRPWVKTADYWQAKAEFHALVKQAIESAGCSIPFPRTDIHVFRT